MGLTNFFQTTPFAPLLAEAPLTCFDVGCRGGIESDLLPLAFAVDAVGFEPDPDEFARLGQTGGTATGPWRSLRYVPAALAGGSGQRTLSIPVDKSSATLLTPDPSAGEPFGKSGFFTVESRLQVETVGLDDAIGRYGLATPDYLKIDVEGAELEVLRSGRRAVDGLLAIKTEIAYLRFRQDQPLAREIDSFLADAGFMLIDLIRPVHWRCHGHLLHPHLARESVPYSRGQLVHGDALYFREPETLGEGEAATARAIKAAMIAMAHGYFDHAERLLARPGVADGLATGHGIEVGAALAHTSHRYGGIVRRHALWRHLRGLSPFVRFWLNRIGAR